MPEELSKDELQAKLAGLSDQWEQAKSINPNSYQNVPDGDYEVPLSEMYLCNARSDGHLQMVIGFSVTLGEHAGEFIRKFHNLEDPKGVARAMQDMRTLGLETGALNVTELPEACEFILHNLRPVAKVRCQTRKSGDREFFNVYVNEATVNPLKEGEEPDPMDNAKYDAPAKTEPSEAASDELIEIGVGSRVAFIVDGVTKDGIVKQIRADGSGELIVLSGGSLIPVDPANCSVLAGSQTA